MPRSTLPSIAYRLSRQIASPAAFSVQHCRRSFATSGSALSSSASPCNNHTLPQISSSGLYSSGKLQLSRNPFSRPRIPHFPPSRQRYAFSSSAVNATAKVLQNPRVDEDGNDLWIKISPRAAERLRAITDPSNSPSPTKEENPYHHLRITVTSGGCHGFQYLMSLEPASKIDPEEDTVFEAGEEAEKESSTTTAAGAGEAKVVMDEPSLALLTGSTVDYTMELIGSQFKIVDNPRATSSCGCGTSFDVKD